MNFAHTEHSGGFSFVSSDMLYVTLISLAALAALTGCAFYLSRRSNPDLAVVDKENKQR